MLELGLGEGQRDTVGSLGKTPVQCQTDKWCNYTGLLSVQLGDFCNYTVNARPTPSSLRATKTLASIYPYVHK